MQIIKDYGGVIACPYCGRELHITPRELQGYPQIAFTCLGCGVHVVHENEVAQRIAAVFATIRVNLSKMKL